jgi:hypothetical protein
MTAEELEEGYAWWYDCLFSHGSIWRRRPCDWRAVPPYLAVAAAECLFASFSKLEIL